VAFSNTLVSERTDFVRSLRAIGIADEQVSVCAVYNPAKLDQRSLQTKLHRYEKSTGVKIASVKPQQSMKGSCGFVTSARSAIL